MDKVTQQNAANSEEVASSMAMFKVRRTSSKTISRSHRREQAMQNHPNASAAELVRPGKQEDSANDIIPMEENSFADFYRSVYINH